MRRVLLGRFPARMVILAFALVLTYVPAFHIPTYRREECRGIVTVAAFLWLRTWALQVGRRLPDRRRADDPPPEDVTAQPPRARDVAEVMKGSD